MSPNYFYNFFVYFKFNFYLYLLGLITLYYKNKEIIISFSKIFFIFLLHKKNSQKEIITLNMIL